MKTARLVRLYSPFLVFSLLILLGSPAAAAIFKCVDKDGEVTFSDTKCDENAKPAIKGDKVRPRQTEEKVFSPRSYELRLPTQDWAVVLDIPGYIVRTERTRPNQQRMMTAENEQTGMVLSIFLEREPQAMSARACRDRYWGRGPLPKTAIRSWETDTMALGQYLVAAVRGVQVRQKHVNAYMGVGDVCIDLHLSKARYTDQDEPLFAAVLESMRVYRSQVTAPAPPSPAPANSEAPDERRIPARAEEKSSNREISEGLIAQLDVASWIPESLKASPDSRRVAWVASAAKVGDKSLVVVDGKEGKQYDDIAAGTPVFSPNSQRVAYVAKVSDKSLVVVDGNEGKQYMGIGTPIFSPNSQRVAYAVAVGEKRFVVVDGKEGTQYDDIGAGIVSFSQDSQRVAYAARVGDKWFVVLDGKEGKQYTAAGIPIFSPNSQRMAYAARVGDKWFVVVDGKEGNQYDTIGARRITYSMAYTSSVSFSPDSQRVAYGASVGGKWFVVVDGKEGKPYDGIGAGPPIFSPDSQRLAHAARLRREWFVVVDGKEGKPYDGIGAGSLVFSPDRQRVAYTARPGREWLVVVDGKEGKQYERVIAGETGRIVFDSPASLHYLAKKDHGIYLVEERIK